MTFNDLNLEYSLRQKLTHVSNAAARVSSEKMQLRISAEQTRKDICNAINHQLSCIRAREQELILSLKKIIAEKERKLCEQQEELNKAISACQQNLESILLEDATVDLVNVMKMLFKLNTIDLRPKETLEICFEFDPSNLRQDIATFGKITTVDHQSKIAAESLPLDVEHYENGGLLSHKSVLQLASNCEPSTVGIKDIKPTMSDSIIQWLSQTSTPESECDFEITGKEITSLSDSSIEIIGNKENSTATSESLNNRLAEFDCLPQNYWLKNDGKHFDYSFPDLSKLVQNLELENEVQLMSSNETLSNKPINRKRTANEIQAAMFQDDLFANQSFQQPAKKSSRFVFGDVIETIQSSDNQQWLLKSRKFSLPTLYTSPSFNNMDDNDKPMRAENLCLFAEKRMCLQRSFTETNENCKEKLNDLSFWLHKSSGVNNLKIYHGDNFVDGSENFKTFDFGAIR